MHTASATAESRPQHSESRTLPFTGFRPDIQGLRAVAVGVVLLFHANFPFMNGGFIGVDVFFVISGYLITGLLLREALTRGRIDLADFYARRARRILPAATIVLIATLAMTWLFLPQIRWEQIGIEAAGAAVYIVNWILAKNTDYLNADTVASPIQHFWTLSVEEQFYIVWPLLLIAALWLAVRMAKRSSGGPLSQERVLGFAAGGIALILVPSLAWSVFYTGFDPAPAYFVTTTRLWELAIGAALAVFAPQLSRMPDWLGYLLGWAGLAGILVASFFYTSTAPAFPGSAALLPTLAAAAVIAGGLGGRAERGVGRLLGLKPMRWIGDISYSLYLWHWPLVVVGTYLLGGELRFRWGLAIVVFSILPAWLSYRFVENPFRDWKRLKASAKRSLSAGAGLVAVTLLCSAAIVVTPILTAPPTPSAAEIPELGAEKLVATAKTAPDAIDLARPEYFSGSDRSTSDALIASFKGAGAPVDSVEGGFLPNANDARKDNPELYARDCHLKETEGTPRPCVFGDPNGTTTIVFIGDSHAAVLSPALDELAKQKKWRVITHVKLACSFADVSQTRFGGEFPTCDEWNRKVLTQIETEQPDLVLTINAGRRGVWQDGAALKNDAREQAFSAGLRRTWAKLNELGIPVRVVMDTPEMGQDMPDCVSANPHSLTRCAVERKIAIDDRPHPELTAAEGLTNTQLIDINDWICPDAVFCPAVIGNVQVWRDSDHLTQTFSKTLAEPLGYALLSTQKSDGKW